MFARGKGRPVVGTGGVVVLFGATSAVVGDVFADGGYPGFWGEGVCFDVRGFYSGPPDELFY